MKDIRNGLLAQFLLLFWLSFKFQCEVNWKMIVNDSWNGHMKGWCCVTFDFELHLFWRENELTTEVKIWERESILFCKDQLRVQCNVITDQSGIVFVKVFRKCDNVVFINSLYEYRLFALHDFFHDTCRNIQPINTSSLISSCSYDAKIWSIGIY